MSVEVSTPVFEGPFDLLLHLILREQVDLYAVSLSRIVDAYLVEIERMQSIDLDVATEFLLIAATLVELKARRLLPGRESVGPDERFAGLLPDLLEGVSPERLRNAFVRAQTPKPVARIDLFHVAPVRASVADALEELVDELPRLGRVSFRRLTDALVERLEVIVRFLAVLELFKQGMVELDQGEQFGDIEIEWTGGRERVSVGALVDDY